MDQLLVFGVLLFVQLLFIAGTYIWSALALGGMARKAGQPAWAGWVPFFNVVVFFRLAGMTPLWFFLSYGALVIVNFVTQGIVAALQAQYYQAFDNSLLQFAAVAGVLGVVIFIALLLVLVIIGAIAIHRINRNFGQGGGYTAFGIFFQLIWMSVLAWGSAQWQGQVPAEPAVDPALARQPRADAPLAAGAGYTPYAASPPPPPAPTAPGGAPVLAAPGAIPPPPPARPSNAPSTILAPPPPPPPAVVARPSQPARSPWEPPITSAPVGMSSPAPAPPPPPIAAAVPPLVQRPAALVPPPAAPTPPAQASPSAPTGLPVYDAVEGATVAVPSRSYELDEEEDRTVIAPRIAAVRYSLVLDDGSRLSLTADDVLLGRKPSADRERPNAQLLAVPDPTKTMSKNHAVLRRQDDRWVITDLASTNGVATYAADGAEVVLASGAPTQIAGDFALGQARMRIERES